MSNTKQRFSTEHQFTDEEQARFEHLEAVIRANGWEIFSVSLMGSALGGVLVHSKTLKRIHQFIDGTEICNAAQDVIAGVMSVDEFLARLTAASLMTPDVQKPLVDFDKLWRRDLVHCGPNPMGSTVNVRMFYERKAKGYGILRFRPAEVSSSDAAANGHWKGPIAPEDYRNAWRQIMAEGFQTEGNDNRFGEPLPLNAFLDLSAPLTGTPQSVRRAATEWRTYLDDPEKWHLLRGEPFMTYVAVYLSGGDPDWLEELRVWRFGSHCPERELMGLRWEAAREIAEDSLDHFHIKLIVPSETLGLLALDNLDLAPLQKQATQPSASSDDIESEKARLDPQLPN